MKEQWINVNDKLPVTVGHAVGYLVYQLNGDMAVSAWMNIGGWDWEPQSPITHWMLLPEPPQVAAEGIDKS